MKNKDETKAWREAYEEYCKEHIPSGVTNLQNVFTPYELCYDIVRKLESYVGDFSDKTFCIFNLEFAEILCYDFGVSMEKIWFVTDCKEKVKFCLTNRYNGINIVCKKFGEFLKEKPEMKMDVVIMNPPYQGNVKKSKNDKGSKGSRNTIWQHFVTKSFDILKDNGYLVAVHPPRWRKPEDKTGELLRSKSIKYLEIHDKKDGMSTFGCMTRYDWYIVQNKKTNGDKIVIVDENGKITKLKDSKLPFISHYDFNILSSIIAKNGEKRCEVFYSRSSYGNDKRWMSDSKNNKFKYPCVHSTTKTKVRFLYSSHKNNGFFGIPKVIFGDNGGDTGIYNAVLDSNGEYGITDHAIAIRTHSKTEGQKIIKAIQSEKFTNIIHACQYGGFQIEWRMFKYFKKDFWKEFI